MATPRKPTVRNDSTPPKGKMYFNYTRRPGDKYGYWTDKSGRVTGRSLTEDSPIQRGPKPRTPHTTGLYNKGRRPVNARTSNVANRRRAQ